MSNDEYINVKKNPLEENSFTESYLVPTLDEANLRALETAERLRLRLVKIQAESIQVASFPAGLRWTNNHKSQTYTMSCCSPPPIIRDCYTAYFVPIDASKL